MYVKTIKKFCAAEAKFGLVELGLVYVELGGVLSLFFSLGFLLVGLL